MVMLSDVVVKVPSVLAVVEIYQDIFLYTYHCLGSTTATFRCTYNA